MNEFLLELPAHPPQDIAPKQWERIKEATEEVKAIMRGEKHPARRTIYKNGYCIVYKHGTLVSVTKTGFTP